MLGLALLACDPGFNIQTTITVPDDVAAAYSPEQRGLLLTRIVPDGYGDELYALAVVCGDGGSFTVGTGSLGTLPDTTIQAWIEPLAADTARPCGEVPEMDQQHFDPTLSHVSVDDDEPQAREVVEAAHGCDSSNLADVELTLAAP